MKKQFSVGRRVMLKSSSEQLVVCPDITNGVYPNNDDAVWVMPYPHRLQYVPTEKLEALSVVDQTNLSHIQSEQVNNAVHAIMSQLVDDVASINAKVAETSATVKDNNKKIEKIKSTLSTLTFALAASAITFVFIKLIS